VSCRLNSKFGTEPLQIAPNLLFQLRTSRKLLIQLRGQPFHFVAEGFTIIFDILGPCIAAGAEHAVVVMDILQFGHFEIGLDENFQCARPNDPR